MGGTVVLFTVIVTSIGIGQNAADTLFFLRFGVENLPTMIVLSGPAVLIGTLIYAGGLGRVGPRRWLPVILGSSAVVLVLERVGITMDVPGVYPAIWLVGQTVAMVSFTLAWTTAAEVCTTRQAKRLFPIFASAGIAGGIIGNALTGVLASLLGTENLLVVQSALLALAAVTVAAIGRRFFRPTGPEVVSVMSDFRIGLVTTWRSRLLRLAMVVALALNVLFFLVVFPFSEVVAASFDTEVGVAGYLGLFSSLATGATFVVSLVIANRLFARFGVIGTLFVVPLVYVAGFSIWLAWFGLGSASIVRGMQWVAVNAIGVTAWSSLFNVLSKERRGQVMAFMQAGPSQVGSMISGAILMAGAAMSQELRTFIGLVFGIGLGVVVWRMRNAYSEALVDGVRRGLVDVFSSPVAGMQKPDLDADTLAALSSTASDRRPVARRTAVSMLGRFEDPRVEPLVEAALEDPDPTVRIAALSVIRQHPERWEEELEGALTDPDPSVRHAALDAAYETGASPTQAGDALEDPDAEVRAMAAVVVGGVRGTRVVESLLASDAAHDVAAGLRALGVRPELAGIDLSSFLEHPDRKVRAAAALPVVGTGSCALLRPLLDDPSVTTRIAVARALTTTDDGIGVLFQVLEDGSVRATDAALRSIVEARCGGRRLAAWASNEVHRAAYLRKHRVALEASNGGGAVGRYLVRVLQSRQELLERWALMALSEGESQSMATVIRGVWSNDEETRSQALEALDSMTDRAVAGEILPLLEDDSASSDESVRTSLRVLSDDFDEWIRALARHWLADDLRADLEQLSGESKSDPSQLVRESLSRLEVPDMQETRTLDTMECVVALSSIPLLGDIDPEDLQAMAGVTSERHFGPGELIYSEGDDGDEMVLVLTGHVVASHRRDGAVQVIREFGPGDHVGELSLLRGRPRAADVVAGPDGASGLVLGSEAFRAILEERPEVAMAMLASLAERLATS